MIDLIKLLLAVSVMYSLNCRSVSVLSSQHEEKLPIQVFQERWDCSLEVAFFHLVPYETQLSSIHLIVFHQCHSSFPVLEFQAVNTTLLRGKAMGTYPVSKGRKVRITEKISWWSPEWKSRELLGFSRRRHITKHTYLLPLFVRIVQFLVCFFL